MTTVDNLLTSDLTVEKRLEFKSLGRDTPVFVFPGKRQCNLNQQYRKYEWLSGCPSRKSLFCFPCLLFKQGTSAWSSKSGFTDLGNYTNSVRKHLKSPSHIAAATALKLLGRVRSDAGFSGGGRASRMMHNERVRKNREFLWHHVRAAVFLAAQGLAFGEHRQSEDGNFIELVALLAEFSAEVMMQKAITDFNLSFSAFSSDIQTDMIFCIYKELESEIVSRIKTASFISIMADETTEISNSSQLAVSVRLVHEGRAGEYLLDFVDASEDGSSERLTSVISESLKSFGVTEKTAVIGQSYDQSRLQAVWPRGRFFHCYAHKWPIVIQTVCGSIPEVSLFFGLLQNVINFFKASPKRSKLLSSTSWLSRGKSVSYLFCNYDDILSLLSAISKNSDFGRSGCAEAKSLCSQMKSTETAFCLRLFKQILDYSKVMTKELQSWTIDPDKVSSQLRDLTSNLTAMQSEESFREYFEQAKQLSYERKHRKSQLSQENELDDQDRLRRVMFEVVGVLLSEIQVRFEQMDSLKWTVLFQPSHFDSLRYDAAEVVNLVNNLSAFDSSLVEDKETFRNQLHVLYSDPDLGDVIREREINDPASLFKCMYELSLCEPLPMISNALKALVTIPLTRVSCDRNASLLRRLKTCFRSSIRLKHLLILYIERDLLKSISSKPSFVDNVITTFAKQKDRRMALLFRE